MKNSNRDAATAYHEAGHVVAAVCLGFEVEYVTIVPDDVSAGHTKIAPEEPSTCDAILRGDRWDPARFRAEKRVMVWQAGELAQRVHNSNSVRSHHFRTDRRNLELLRLYAPDEEKRDVKAHVGLLRTWTAHLISQHWPSVDAVANALLDCPTLFGARINEIIGRVEEEHRMMEVQPLLDAVEAIKAMRGE